MLILIIQLSMQRNSLITSLNNLNSVRVQGQQADSAASIPRNFVYTRNKLLCEHCKMRNHNRDKCFKLHGYPVYFKAKNKRVIASVLLDDSLKDHTSGDMINMTVTQEQHKQVLQYLEKQQAY